MVSDGSSMRAGRRMLQPALRVLAVAGALCGLLVVAGGGDGVTSGLAPAFGPTKNIWIDRHELQAFPASGAAWDDLAEDALRDWGAAEISDQDSRHDVFTLAGALYAVRMNDTAVRDRVVESILSAIGTEDGGRSLALARNLTAYVLAADLIGFRDQRFSQWLNAVRFERMELRTLVETHEDRPNNWGTHAGAARIAAGLYLGDDADVSAATMVFRGYLGDRDAYAEFRFGDPEWQADPSAPVAINPKGAKKNGVMIDGVIVDDIRRCECPVSDPPPKEKYQWEAMQGVMTQATLLARAGEPGVWEWSDRAIWRAVRFLYDRADYPASGDNNFLSYLIDAAFGTRTSDGVDARRGQSIGYTDWTHAAISDGVGPVGIDGPARAGSRAVRLSVVEP